MDPIIYHDNHLVAYAKPAGLASQPEAEGDDSAESRVKGWLKDFYNKPGNVFCQAVHRLDRPATGVLIFARNSKSLSRLQATFRERRSKKHYWALTLKAPPAIDGVLEHHLRHEEHFARVVAPGVKGAQEARLRYHFRERQGGICWLEVELDTGRYHQIRAQLAAIGCPLIGDARYGGHPHAGFHSDAIGLHHERLELPHPVKDELLDLRAPVPKNWPIWIRRPSTPRPESGD